MTASNVIDGTNATQLLSYMKLMDIPLGLVINFGDYRLGKRGISRVILAGADAVDETSIF